jgi:pyridoxal phosphate enzyme (YggS family)
MMVELGVLDLGENRPQELWRKAEELKDLPIRWHLVGHLQRNKVERTLPLVDLIHSVDSVRLYEAIAFEARKQRIEPFVLLQVNASGEYQKHGFNYDELWQLESKLEPAIDSDQATLSPVIPSGLMGMAAYSDDPEQSRSTFKRLRECLDRLREEWLVHGRTLELLSMGMSGDFDVAIEEGATLVRIGTTLFEGLEGE